ncbi:MAG: hypothetical protein ACRBBK_11695 [Paracoccaceae bacterium]
MKRFTALIGLFVLLLLGAELYARFALGLGQPPLYVTHPTIEYMLAPDQDLRRFGKYHHYNACGMRSPALDQITQPQRIMVFGDSVLNGGSQTDQSDLATSIATDSQSFFGNVSAGSWGPENIAAWIEVFGFQGAQTAIIVISAHDLYDTPTFAPLNPQTHPTKAPILALWEGIARYLPRYLPAFMKPPKAIAPPEISAPQSIVKFIDLVAAADLRLCAIQHQTRRELELPPSAAHTEIKALFETRGAPVLDFGNAMRTAKDSAYQDDIHITPKGQALLAGYLAECAQMARIPTPLPH